MSERDPSTMTELELLAQILRELREIRRHLADTDAARVYVVGGQVEISGGSVGTFDAR